MSSPSPTSFMGFSPRRILDSSPKFTNEKSCLESEIRKLNRTIEFKEDVIKELNRTLLLEDFQENPTTYVRSLVKNSLTTSADKLGQKVRSIFQKHSPDAYQPEWVENAILKRIEKVRSLSLTQLELKAIEMNPQFQKSPRHYLLKWQEEQLEDSKTQEIIESILSDTSEN